VLGQLTPPMIKDWWRAAWAAFVAGQRVVCQRTARPEPVGARGGSKSAVPRWGRAVVPAAVLRAEVIRRHLLTAERPRKGTAAVRADRRRVRHARGTRVRVRRVWVFAAAGDSRFLTRRLAIFGYRRD
jgi:hypothetical protein